MLIPIGVLAAGSILAGFPFKELFAGHGVEEFFRESLKMHPHIIDEMHHIPQCDRVSADRDDGDLASSRRGSSTSAGRTCRSNSPPAPDALPVPAQQVVLRRALRLDLRAPGEVARPRAVEGGDGYVIDGFGPDGVSARVLDVTRNVVRLQTGYLYHYAFAMLIGVAALITWFMFGLGGQ
jgi:NADH-quinone oxidoreductase subunit L